MIEDIQKSCLQMSDFVQLGKIGQGSFSQVLKVRYIDDGRIYALKKIRMSSLKQKQRQYAINQIKILASLHSEYIVSYRWSFFDHTSHYLCIVMEFANQGDLQVDIQNRKKNQYGRIPQSQIWRAIYDMLMGLKQLHQKCILHRDIKTANIFKSEGKYKIGDLNIAKICPNMIACTQTGTPYYASPQVWNQKPYDEKSDIWSLGCVIYEMCELQPPFTGANMQKLYQMVNIGRYREISSQYSQSLSKFIKICLKVSAKQRMTSNQLLQCEWVQNKLKTYKIIHNQQNNKQISEKILTSKYNSVPLNDQKHQDKIIKNNSYKQGIRPKRKLKTAADDRPKLINISSSIYDNKRYNTHQSASKYQQNTQKIRQKSIKKHNPGAIKTNNLLRPLSAHKAEQLKRYRYRISYAKKQNNIRYNSVNSIKKIQPKITDKNISSKSLLQEHKNKINNQRCHTNTLEQQTQKCLIESNAKQNDILKKLIQKHQQKYDRNPIRNHNYCQYPTRRPLTSVTNDLYSKNNSNYNNIVSKQQLRKQINHKHTNLRAINKIDHPIVANQSYRTNYMNSILNRIRK